MNRSAWPTWDPAPLSLAPFITLRSPASPEGKCVVNTPGRCITAPRIPWIHRNGSVAVSGSPRHRPIRIPHRSLLGPGEGSGWRGEHLEATKSPLGWGAFNPDLYGYHCATLRLSPFRGPAVPSGLGPNPSHRFRCSPDARIGPPLGRRIHRSRRFRVVAPARRWAAPRTGCWVDCPVEPLASLAPAATDGSA